MGLSGSIHEIEREAALVADAYREKTERTLFNQLARRSGGDTVTHPSWTWECIKRESRYQQRLRKRRPEEWVAIIEALPEHVRTKVAHIVWWDWFAKRPCWRRWPHLDHYLDELERYIENPGLEPSRNDLVLALRELGYSPFKAVQRSAPRATYKGEE